MNRVYVLIGAALLTLCTPAFALDCYHFSKASAQNVKDARKMTTYDYQNLNLGFGMIEGFINGVTASGEASKYFPLTASAELSSDTSSALIVLSYFICQKQMNENLNFNQVVVEAADIILNSNYDGTPVEKAVDYLYRQKKDLSDLPGTPCGPGTDRECL
ncbi:MAG: hypothetical protein KDD40_00160 [Bdellovibrionales bacterium]|nr:hypothetical protein [Bdellovibrionales bacterium]